MTWFRFWAWLKGEHYARLEARGSTGRAVVEMAAAGRSYDEWSEAVEKMQAEGWTLVKRIVRAAPDGVC